MGLLNGEGMDRRFFHRLGASRLDRTICSAAGMAGLDRGARRPLRHRARTVPPLPAHPRLGRQHPRHQRPSLALHHGSPPQRRQASTPSIPAATAPAPPPTSHFFINPGSDAALALAMMHVIIGESLYDADYVARYTEGFDDLRERVRPWTPAARRRTHRHSPPKTSSPWPANTPPPGPPPSASITACSAASAAPWPSAPSACCPRSPARGRTSAAGSSFPPRRRFDLNRAAPGARRPAAEIPRPRSAPRQYVATRLGPHHARRIRPSRRWWSTTPIPPPSRPTRTPSSRGLRRDDLFTVVLEQFQTDTADYADILLPATTFLEHTDL